MCLPFPSEVLVNTVRSRKAISNPQAEAHLHVPHQHGQEQHPRECDDDAEPELARERAWDQRLAHRPADEAHVFKDKELALAKG